MFNDIDTKKVLNNGKKQKYISGKNGKKKKEKEIEKCAAFQHFEFSFYFFSFA